MELWREKRWGWGGNERRGVGRRKGKTTVRQGCWLYRCRPDGQTSRRVGSVIWISGSWCNIEGWRRLKMTTPQQWIWVIGKRESHTERERERDSIMGPSRCHPTELPPDTMGPLISPFPLTFLLSPWDHPPCHTFHYTLFVSAKLTCLIKPFE